MTAVPHQWNQEIARRLRLVGQERTPAEVAEIRRATLPALRLAYAARGIVLPEGDLEVVNFLRQSAGKPPIPSYPESGPEATGRRPMS